ncbi:MAG: PilN domain-containing protein [Chloroflexota bacterium]
MQLPPDPLDEIEADEPKAGGGGLRIVLYLLMLTLGILFVPLYLASVTIEDETQALEQELLDLQATLAVTPSIPADEAELRDMLLDLRRESSALQAAATQMSAAHIDWPTIMAALASYDPARMDLTRIEQTGNGLLLNGSAEDEPLVLAYAALLEQFPEFGTVTVQAITLNAVASGDGDPNVAKVNAEGEPIQPVEFVILIDLEAEQ